MPNRDGTGPAGKGPKTGRKLGNCKRAIPNVKKVDKSIRRRAFGRRNRFGRFGK